MFFEPGKNFYSRAKEPSPSEGDAIAGVDGVHWHRMLFLYRPRQTYMSYRMRRSTSQQAQYNRTLQQKFAATKRVAPPAPAPTVGQPWQPRDEVSALQDLAQLHAAGSLSDAEFAAAKARLLGSPR